MQFTALTSEDVNALRAGAADALENPPERAISTGEGMPCRHCLKNIDAGKEMLIVSFKPFRGSHPYTEIGPIFLCADMCTRGGGADLPAILQSSPDYLIKGYDADERIVYGTGQVVPVDELKTQIGGILADPKIAFVDVRSARNNCYMVRVTRTA